ncbi:glycoside hydrolase family 3 C-terminal domain-containing protein [Streptomyces griseochromogenes]|nr:glycoside hydrolase family 3 C-terminal domain-containing protein [Streptomyces griseochromogenes]
MASAGSTSGRRRPARARRAGGTGRPGRRPPAARRPRPTGIGLPETQEALLRAVAAVRPETALVVMSSYPYAVDWADAHLSAVLWTSHGGQETGRALAAVLLGAADPAGRLPQTWYRGEDSLPHPLDYDIIKAGWTYQYHRSAPLYPFGHGLSYADFTYRDLRLFSPVLVQEGAVDVSVTLANTGTRSGSEVVQLYVRAVGTRYEAPGSGSRTSARCGSNQGTAGR